MATKLGTFVAVGLAATAVHAIAALFLAHFTTAYVANATAFIIATAVTYAGNYRYTFRSQGVHSETVIRFAVVSAATLAASEWVLLFMGLFGAREWATILVAVGVIPLLRFGLMSTHVFDSARWGDQSLRSWAGGWVLLLLSAGAGVVAISVLEPSMLDSGRPAPYPSTMAAAADSFLTQEWQWPLLSISAAGPGLPMSPPDHVPVALLAVPAKLMQPVTGADAGYLRAWALLSFTALGPSVLFGMHVLGGRSRLRRSVPVAVALLVYSAVYEPDRLAPQGTFLVLMSAFLAVQASGRNGHRRRAGAVATCVAASWLVHPVTGVACIAAVSAAGLFVNRVRRRVRPELRRDRLLLRELDRQPV